MNREDRAKAEYLLGYIKAQQDAEDVGQRMETLRRRMETARRAAEDWSGGSAGRHGDLSDYFEKAEEIMEEWAGREKKMCGCVSHLRTQSLKAST